MAGEDVVGEVEEFTLHIKTVWFSLKNTECSFSYGINDLIPEVLDFELLTKPHLDL